MNKRHFISAAALALACAAFGGAQAQPTTIKLGWPTSDSATDPLAMGARAFKQALERQSNGAMQVQLYPNRQLGDDKQLVEGVRFGTVDAAVVTNAVTAQTEPAFGVLDLPFLFESDVHVQKVLDGAVGAELAKRMAAKGVVVLGYFEGGFRSLINNKHPVAQPADMSGIKVRVMQNPIYIDLVNDLGGAAVPMAWGETITALQQGTIEGLELPIALIEPLKVSEFAKYLSLTNHTFTAYELLMGKRLLDRLTEQQQAWVRAAAKEAVLEQRQGMAGQTPRALASLEKTEMKVNPIADVAAFRKAVEPIYEKARKAGQGDLIDAVQAAAPAAK
ncbi:DctP family TRAP transporter solute-binding subunit [Bordetella petrii]|nr:DctP family TRAP transporter solute-binding subunit [Bordetella petrii]